MFISTAHNALKTQRKIKPNIFWPMLDHLRCNIKNDSVQFSFSVVSDSLQPHGLQHTRLPWPSPIPRVYPNSCPLSQWCHPTISSSVVPFSSCLRSFPASGSFQMGQLFASGGQSTGASALVLPLNIQGWFPLELSGLMKSLSLLQHHSLKASISFTQPSVQSSSHIRI